jgi:hypothetical protein
MNKPEQTDLPLESLSFNGRRQLIKDKENGFAKWLVCKKAGSAKEKRKKNGTRKEGSGGPRGRGRIQDSTEVLLRW